MVHAGIAQGKGRSGFNWWIISLLRGPVATVWVSGCVGPAAGDLAR